MPGHYEREAQSLEALMRRIPGRDTGRGGGTQYWSESEGRWVSRRPSAVPDEDIDLERLRRILGDR